MLQGTGSSVGKSLLVAGLCRALKRRGLNPAPFKPQNMSNNAAVTPDGGEIGRAQALQALACGLAPSTDMNPVLLKPQNGASQIVVQGRIHGQSNARDYQSLKPTLMPYVLESFDRLACAHDIVLVEGAGSASEINLRANDIANMGFALARDVPVILIGDIDRGGVIAALVGTHTVLPPPLTAPPSKASSSTACAATSPSSRTACAPSKPPPPGPPSASSPHFEGAARLPREDALDLVPTRPRAKGHRQRIAVPPAPPHRQLRRFRPTRSRAHRRSPLPPP